MTKLEKILADDAKIVLRKIDLNEIKGKHLILTGASGLIGVHFLMTLKLFTSTLNNKSDYPKITALVYSKLPEYMEKVLQFENLKVIQGDITDPHIISSLDKADFIIHAAGYGQPGKFMEDKIKTIEINTGATIRLLEKLAPDGKFLFLSTSEVYSGLPNPPYKENQIGTTNTTHPRACYIESKRCGEAICNTYFEKKKRVRSVRLSLVYGPGTKTHDMRVLNSFIEKGLSGKIDLLDSGYAKRTYCYVSDAIEIMWNILLYGKEPIYNAGGFSKINIVDLAKKIGKILKVKVVIPKEEKKLTGAPENVSLDMNKVAKKFGKNKKDFVPLDRGLTKTIEWQRILYTK